MTHDELIPPDVPGEDDLDYEALPDGDLPAALDESDLDLEDDDFEEGDEEDDGESEEGGDAEGSEES